MFTQVGIIDGTILDWHSGRLADVGVRKRDDDYAMMERFASQVREFDFAKLDALSGEMQRQAKAGVVLPISLLEKAESGIASRTRCAPVPRTTALGPRFNLIDFHAVALENGGVPLTLLEKLVDEWIASTKI